ncbi:hypothetical protein vBDshSR4C_024 [Dinoroseobacter phage vB_DshS-R4C]|nr:hypothetical protein vBDshSR4C_024 [Dinoroseobacter phage vB_DshS-R4C]
MLARFAARGFKRIARSIKKTPGILPGVFLCLKSMISRGVAFFGFTCARKSRNNTRNKTRNKGAPMKPSLAKHLTRCASPIGAAPGLISDHLEAHRAGWIICAGVPQNSTTLRYKLTPAGAAALAGAGGGGGGGEK